MSIQGEDEENAKKSEILAYEKLFHELKELQKSLIRLELTLRTRWVKQHQTISLVLSILCIILVCVVGT